MPEAHPIELRERVVRSYEAGEGTYARIAARFAVGEASVKRWVRIPPIAITETGAWRSPVPAERDDHESSENASPEREERKRAPISTEESLWN